MSLRYEGKDTYRDMSSVELKGVSTERGKLGVSEDCSTGKTDVPGRGWNESNKVE